MFMKYIIFLFYNYYKEGGTKTFPYVKTHSVLYTLLLLNLITFNFFVSSDKEKSFEFLWSNESVMGWNFPLMFPLTYIIFSFILTLMFPERCIKTYNPVGKNVRLHGWLLFTYVVVSYLLFFYILLLLKIHYK